MAQIERILGPLTSIFLWLAAAATAAMMFHVAADVVAKLILRHPIIGTLEMVSLYYMVAVVFLPLGAVQRDRGHIFIELFTQRLGVRVQRSLDALALLLTFLLAATLFWRGFDVAVEKTLVGELANNIEFQIEVWPGRWFPVVGFGLTTAWCLLQLVQDVIVIVSGRAEAAGGPGAES